MFFCSTQLEMSPLTAFAKSLVAQNLIGSISSSYGKRQSRDSNRGCWVRSANATSMLPGYEEFFCTLPFFVILVTRMISGKCKKCRILTTRRKLFGNISLCCTLKIEKVEASLLVMHKWISLAAEATFQVQGLQCNCLIGLGYQVSSGAILKITASA